MKKNGSEAESDRGSIKCGADCGAVRMRIDYFPVRFFENAVFSKNRIGKQVKNTQTRSRWIAIIPQTSANSTMEKISKVQKTEINELHLYYYSANFRNLFREYHFLLTFHKWPKITRWGTVCVGHCGSGLFCKSSGQFYFHLN